MNIISILKTFGKLPRNLFGAMSDGAEAETKIHSNGRVHGQGGGREGQGESLEGYGMEG